MSRANNSIRMALGVRNGIGSQSYPGDGAVGPDDSAFEIVDWFSIPQPLHGFLSLLTIIWMHDFQRGPWGCVEALSCAAPDRFVCTIDEQNLAAICIADREDVP